MTKMAFLLLALAACDTDPPDETQPSGQGETVFTAGDDPTNAFFQSLGTNGRTCATCHDRDAGWSITPTAVRARFDASGGADPLFRAVDGANAPGPEDVAESAHTMLLAHGLIRVGQKIPDGAEFTLASAVDPYKFATAAQLSLFRRPLPATNLRFLATIMWDGREATLASQATDATLGHAQAMAITDPAAIDEAVAFESSLYTAQRFDDTGGDLAEGGGGAQALSTQNFQLGNNDGTSFNRDVFTIYARWTNADGSSAEGRRRAQIARGEQIFNTERFRIRGVGGLADQQGTCSTCHDTPNVGSHSVPLALDIGISDDDDDAPRGLPMYTLANTATGQTRRTTDPGLALITGKWADIGKFKVPSLRGLAMRPPYFHNGFASDLDDVVRFYRRKFGMRLSDDEEAALVAFLAAL